MSDFSHRWDLSPREAHALQEELAPHVSLKPRLGPVETVAGVDASYRDGVAQAAVALLSYPELTLLEYVTARRPIEFPYVPGLLTFREGPAVLEALAQLSTPPDLLIFDGQGRAHPRRLGIASHIGLLLDRPAIGCAKSRLCGRHQEPAPERGSFTLLIDKDEIIGVVVRTRSKVKPLFVSPGHRVNLATSLAFVLTCAPKYRLPETTRWADKIAGGQRPPLQHSLEEILK